MALDGFILSKVVTTLRTQLPIKINKIIQPTPHDIALVGYGTQKINLFISAHPVNARLHATTQQATQVGDPSHFLVMLRKHLQLGWIRNIKQLQNDRIVSFDIEHRDEMGVLRTYHLILEIIGRKTNLVLVNDQGIIVDAIHRVVSFESEARNMIPGSPYTLPEPQQKLALNQWKKRDLSLPLRQAFYGMSPRIEKEILHRLDQGMSWDDIVDAIETSDVVYQTAQELSIIELTHLNTMSRVFPLMEGIDQFYHTSQVQDQIKSVSHDMAKIIRRELKKATQKLPKLIEEQKNAEAFDRFKIEGELLYAFGMHLQAGHTQFDTFTFEGNPITIQLNETMSGKENAAAKFKQYQKLKTSIQYRDAMIESTKQNIDYYSSLIEQLSFASVQDAIEIRNELIDSGIIRQTKPKKYKKHQPTKPHITTIPFDDDTVIYIGKNNIQNDYVTFKIGRKTDTWFHAAYTSGAHVVLQTTELTEARIRACAQLAAYFSKHKHGSSVEVHYTSLNHVQRISGAKKGLVKLKEHQSIYIDPDAEFIQNLMMQSQS